MNKKKIIAMISSYIIYLIFYLVTMIVAIKIARSFRNISYYNNEIFSHYIKKTQLQKTGYEDEEYLNKLSSSFNLYYSKKPIYEINELNRLEKLEINLEILPLYKYNQKHGKGFLIYVNHLVYKNEDLMGRDRLSPAPKQYNPLNPLYISFSFKNNDLMKKYNKILFDPMRVIYFTDLDLSNYGDIENQVTGFKIFSNEEDNLLICCNEKSNFYKEDSLFKYTNLDLSDKNYEMNINYKNPTLEDISNCDIYYKKQNYGKYNRDLIIICIVIPICFIIFAYFIFAHKYVKEYLDNKRKSKKIKE